MSENKYSDLVFESLLRWLSRSPANDVVVYGDGYIKVHSMKHRYYSYKSKVQIRWDMEVSKSVVWQTLL